MQTTELDTEIVIRCLRIFINDLCDKTSPFPKNEAYFINLSGWIAEAACRLEAMEKKP